MLADDAFMVVVVVVLSLESRRLFATTTTTRFYFMPHDFVPRAGSKLSLFFLFLLRLGFRVYFFFFAKFFTLKEDSRRDIERPKTRAFFL